MVSLVRVDDRLVHGQITTTWVPYIKAGAVLIASDEVAASRLKTDAIECCAYSGLCIVINSVADAAAYAESEELAGVRTIMIVAGLDDAMRLYDTGLKFTSLNIGNIHNFAGKCRELTSSVCINEADDEILERFVDMGVEIDLRDVPTSSSGPFKKRG
jgi:mannose/fructose/N-acetylgalactosamine-specific phosphotransferase system component IIB